MALTKVVVRGAFGFDTRANSDDVAISDTGESMAIQSEKDNVDINNIVDKWTRTGVVNGGAKAPQFGDFSDMGDYQSMLNSVIEAESKFMELPAETRAKFGNDPARLIEAAQDPANLELFRSLGMADPAPAPVEPQKVVVVGTQGGGTAPPASGS